MFWNHMNMKIFLVLVVVLFCVPSDASAGYASLFNSNGDSAEVIFNNYPTNTIVIDVGASAGGGSQQGGGRGYNGYAEAIIGSSTVVDNQPIASDGGSVSVNNSMTIVKNASGNWMNGGTNMGTSVWITANAFFDGENCVCSSGAYGEITWVDMVTGNINVSSNIAGASYTITGPAILNGSGVSSSHANQPTGGYTITWNDVAGYTKPGSSSQTLSSGGTISFVGNYSGVAPTCSYTGPINWVEPTGLECSVGVSYNSVPVGGQRTATDSNASGNGYTGSYTAECVGSNSWQYVSHVCNAPVVTTINVNFE